MKLQCSVSALTLTLALASQPVLAQGHGGGSHGGGGHGGGGGYHGGGSAVPRGSGYVPHGGMAQQRHPQAGTGTGYHYGYGYGHGYGHGHGGYGHGGYGHGGYGHSHGGYYPYYGYRPYYPYYAYPYYSYWPGISLSFGWGYGSSSPYYYGDYSASPAYSMGAYPQDGGRGSDDGGAEAPPPRDVDRSYDDHSYDDRSSGRVRLEVRPDDASVYVDDQFHGTAREARIMKLRGGPHVIELIRPGFAVERREVTVVSGESRDVLVELQRASH